MKPSAYLINTSRGPIVDEAALIDALRAGRIAGAGLDVYDVEPLPVDHPLRSLRNTLLLPHIGYVTSDNYRTFYRHAVEDIVAFTAGTPVRALSPTATSARRPPGSALPLFGAALTDLLSRDRINPSALVANRSRQRCAVPANQFDHRPIVFTVEMIL